MSRRNGLVIRKPDDFHVHLRKGDMLRAVLPATARDFARALVMPNLKDPNITDAALAIGYREEILSLAPGFTPLMTIFLTGGTKRRTTVQTIRDAFSAGVIAAKYYPAGGTTNSEDGIPPEELRRGYDDVLATMIDIGMVLCVHAEDPGCPLLKREQGFLPILKAIIRRHPKLRIVIEHVTTREGILFVLMNRNVAATITVHHLLLTTDDVIGDHDGLCMPVAKSEEDRRALVEAALSGHPRIFFGSDSAPHTRSAKERARGAFGLYTAPVALPLLAEIFETYERLNMLEGFVSEAGASFYQLALNTGEIEIVNEASTVCASLEDPGDPLPFRVGQKIRFQVRRS